MPKTSLLDRDPAYREALFHIVATGGKSIEKMHGEVEGLGFAVPEIKAFSRHVAAVRRLLESEPWSLSSPHAVEMAPRVLPVLAAVVSASRGQKRALTVLEANRVDALLRAAPTLSPWWAIWLAHKYIAREAAEPPVSTNSLDILLAYRPWESQEAFDHFMHDVRDGMPEWLPNDGRVEGALMDALWMEFGRGGPGQMRKEDLDILVEESGDRRVFRRGPEHIEALSWDFGLEEGWAELQSLRGED